MTKMFEPSILGFPVNSCWEVIDDPKVKRVLKYKEDEMAKVITASAKLRKPAQGFLILGSPMTGKTTLASMIAKRVFEKAGDFEVYYDTQDSVLRREDVYSLEKSLPVNSVCVLDDLTVCDKQWQINLITATVKKILSWSAIPVFVTSMSHDQMSDCYGSAFFNRMKKRCNLVHLKPVTEDD